MLSRTENLVPISPYYKPLVVRRTFHKVMKLHYGSPVYQKKQLGE